MRISIVGWQTTSEDVDRSAHAILAAARTVAGGPDRFSAGRSGG